MIDAFDGSTATPSPPCKVPAWIQIHKVPPLYRTEGILRMLALKVGEEAVVEMRVVASLGGDFHRARVLPHAEKPLVRFVTLAPEGKETILLQIKYEKIPRYCAHCGLMGHTHLECGADE